MRAFFGQVRQYKRRCDPRVNKYTVLTEVFCHAACCLNAAEYPFKRERLAIG